MSTVFFVDPTTVTITRNPAFGTDWWPFRVNQYSVVTADGGFKTWDAGPTVIEGIIIINNILKSQGDDLRDLLSVTALFASSVVDITPPANTDLGGGAGGQITANIPISDLKDVLTLVPPGRYNLRLPYRIEVV